MQFISTYIFFACWLAGVRVRELDYVGVYVYNLVARLILPNCTTTFEQELFDEKRAEMSLYNLSKIIHVF